MSGSLWRSEHADQMAVIIDAELYFEAVREAMLNARQRILLVGWDFDARIRLGGQKRLPGEPQTIGEFISWLVKRTPTLQIYLLRWDLGALKSVVRGTTILSLLKWMSHPRIHTKLDGHHPTGASHHQKLVAIDDCLAFCGGIDITGGRWDRRLHADHDADRKDSSGNPYKPWHDATTAITGEAAFALAELCRGRWQRATGTMLPAIRNGNTCWPDVLKVDFADVEVGIARTFPSMPEEEPVQEIEALFLEQIAGARRHVYIESQYFASRKIAEAVARRLDEPDGPEFVIINPFTAQGWLEPLAMDTARARLIEALRRRDHAHRLAVYHPVTKEGEPIYVHAKILIVDDRQLRIGSANMNNRSLGLDTECDAIVGYGDERRPDVEQRIRELRTSLLAEHLGQTEDRVRTCVDECGSIIQAIEKLRGSGKTLQPYETPDLSDVEEWLADNEILDPEAPEEMFETVSRPGLFRRWSRL